MEAAKLGFSHVIVPWIHAPAASGRLANIDIIKCRTIKDALLVGPSLSHASYSVTAKACRIRPYRWTGMGRLGYTRGREGLLITNVHIRMCDSLGQVHKIEGCSWLR